MASLSSNALDRLTLTGSTASSVPIQGHRGRGGPIRVMEVPPHPLRGARGPLAFGVPAWPPGPYQPVPVFKRRWELSREEALRPWAEKRQQGWQACEPPWALAPKRAAAG